MDHTILLVEDDDDLREVMRDALEANGYDVVAARNGQEALDELPEIRHLCLVLLDLVMPRMNGWEFYEKVREREALAEVPIVVHSSSTTRAPQGAARVLRKPISLEVLLSVVQEHCPR